MNQPKKDPPKKRVLYLGGFFILLGVLNCMGVGGPYHAMGYGDIDNPSREQLFIVGLLLIACGISLFFGMRSSKGGS